jgi:transposase
LPAQPTPDQGDWLQALYAGEAEMGESRLVERDGTWYLHVTATRDVKNCSGASTDERTPIGVDIGEASLVTVCHRDDQGVPTHPELWAEEGKTVRRLRKT